MLLAHLSDIHVRNLKGTRPWRFLSKRATGGLNLLFNRSKIHLNSVLEAALDRIHQLQCDHVVVTGDLSNLALESEFEAAREALELNFGHPDHLSVIPGNHDRYTIGSTIRRLFERSFSDYLHSDLPEIKRRNGVWPFVRLLNGVAIVGLNSAIPLPAFISGGRIGGRQRRALAESLAHPEVQSRFSVVLIHHHLFTPVNSGFDLPRSLFDAPLVRRVLAQGEANLVLHGHNHLYGWHTIPYPHSDGRVLICEAGSSSVSTASNDVRSGKFNVYRIEDNHLTGFDTYKFHYNHGFELWKRWQIGPHGPHL
jgi:3',5'-cyclic AMP phosphodiesterase CpdA